MSQVYYDTTPTEGRARVQELFQDVTILDRHLSWERLMSEYGYDYPLPSLLCSLVAQALVTDRGQKGFPLGWGRLVYDLIARPRRMAWGPAILAEMYHELHEIVYHEGGSWACGAVLAQIWAWEHIAVIRPRVQPRERSQPYIFGYRGFIPQRHSGDVTYYRRLFDELTVFTWRPYRECGRWSDSWELEYMRYSRPLVGRSSDIVERFVISRVWRQFAEQQGISVETTTYARMRTDEGLGWLPMLDYHTAVRDTAALVATPWDYHPDVADARADLVYLYEM